MLAGSNLQGAAVSLSPGHLRKLALDKNPCRVLQLPPIGHLVLWHWAMQSYAFPVSISAIRLTYESRFAIPLTNGRCLVGPGNCLRS